MDIKLETKNNISQLVITGDYDQNHSVVKKARALIAEKGLTKMLECFDKTMENRSLNKQ